MRIGVISDTHGFIDQKILDHLSTCDQIWHAGDVGRKEVLEKLSGVAELKAVYGNIDGTEIRVMAPEVQVFDAGGKKVVMTHIAGYPNRYNKEALQLIREHKPDIFVCGHSHILKVMFDKLLGHLHINPGAAGKQGMHKVRTLIRFSIENGKIGKMEVVEMKK